MTIVQMGKLRPQVTIATSSHLARSRQTLDRFEAVEGWPAHKDESEGSEVRVCLLEGRGPFIFLTLSIFSSHSLF